MSEQNPLPPELEVPVQPVIVTEPVIEGPVLSWSECVIGTFYRPGEVFTSFLNKIRWMAPWIIQTVVAVLMVLVTIPNISAKVMEKMPDTPGGPGGAMVQTMMWVGGIVGALFMPIIGILFLGLVLWVITLIFGGTAKFKEYMAVAAHSTLPTVIGSILAGILMLATNEIPDLTPAVLVTSEDAGVLKGLLQAMGPLFIWTVVLWGIGINKINRWSGAKGYFPAIIIWVVYAVLLMVMGAFGLGGSNPNFNINVG